MGAPRTCECGTCAKCKHREYMNEYYRKDPQKIRDIATASRWRMIERVREYDRKRGTRIYDPVKEAARLAVTHAIEAGRLTRQPCEVCGVLSRFEDGRSAIQAHHDDYSKPLEVRWLCSRHHGELHRRIAA